MPNPVFIGQDVQLPMKPNLNGGVDRSPGKVVKVLKDGNGDPLEGPNGGIMINAKVFPNASLLGIDIVADVEFHDYEEDARDRGFELLTNEPRGAWPLDYTFI